MTLLPTPPISIPSSASSSTTSISGKKRASPPKTQANPRPRGSFPSPQHKPSPLPPRVRSCSLIQPVQPPRPRVNLSSASPNIPRKTTHRRGNSVGNFPIDLSHVKPKVCSFRQKAEEVTEREARERRNTISVPFSQKLDWRFVRARVDTQRFPSNASPTCEAPQSTTASSSASAKQEGRARRTSTQLADYSHIKPKVDTRWHGDCPLSSFMPSAKRTEGRRVRPQSMLVTGSASSGTNAKSPNPHVRARVNSVSNVEHPSHQATKRVGNRLRVNSTSVEPETLRK
ncbi:uncharacterized protein VTP21DRAFT_3276 [Calcarisporiella thermophila]|uniref:uncharacterized protein n=1 Tax=Calcarisporiella thermophila TaxID=911321 RepID=UPI0037427F51